MDFNQFLILNEILESSSSDEEEVNFITNLNTKERPKIKNFLNIINEYSDKEVSKFITMTIKYLYMYIYSTVVFNMLILSLLATSVISNGCSSLV